MSRNLVFGGALSALGHVDGAKAKKAIEKSIKQETRAGSGGAQKGGR